MTRPSPRRPRLVAGALLGLALLSWASRAAPIPAIVNETPSLPRGLYLRVASASPSRGAVVAVAPPAAARAYLRSLGAPDRLHLLKRVAALEADPVCRAGDAVRTPQHYVAVRRRDRRGAALPGWRGCGPLPAGQVFLLGDSPDSFDSRYFGPVGRDAVEGVFRAVLTW